MKTTGLDKLYSRLDAAERYRLLMQAIARGDEAERDRLFGSSASVMVPDAVPSPSITVYRLTGMTQPSMGSVLDRSLPHELRREHPRGCPGSMKKRWLAAGMAEAERSLRRVKGCKEMPVLVGALRHSYQECQRHGGR